MPHSFFLAEDYTFSAPPPPDGASVQFARENDADGQRAAVIRREHLADVGGDGPVLGCFNSLYKVCGVTFTCDV